MVFLLRRTGPRRARTSIGSSQDRLPVSGQEEASASARELEGHATEIAQLREAIASRATIEQAKGIVMARYGVGPDHAFEVLTTWSQSTHVKLRVLAEGLVSLTSDDPRRAEDARVLNLIVEQLDSTGRR